MNLAALVIATTMVQADGLDTSFKSYMDYTTITNTESKQYELQQKAYTDNDGLRRYGALGDYMIAVGTPYADVGDRVLVTLDTDKSFYAIVGDSKGDVWYHDCSKGACVVEFIVDTPCMDEFPKKMGDCSYIGDFEGEVISISVLPSYKDIKETITKCNLYKWENRVFGRHNVVKKC